jgi:hypothetical protein
MERTTQTTTGTKRARIERKSQKNAAIERISCGESQMKCVYSHSRINRVWSGKRYVNASLVGRLVQ